MSEKVRHRCFFIRIPYNFSSNIDQAVGRLYFWKASSMMLSGNLAINPLVETRVFLYFLNFITPITKY